jgi:hypothetical protein
VLSYPLGELGRPYEPIVVKVTARGLESSYFAARAKRPGVQLPTTSSE